VTVGELKAECDRVRKQGVKFMVVCIGRHGGARMQIMKGLLGNVVGSDKHGSFVSVDISKVEAKIRDMDPAIEIPQVSQAKARVVLP
jgi:hypothetical protein